MQIRVESNDFKEIVAKGESTYKDIRRQDGKREFLFEFVPTYRGVYNILIEMYYKQKYFIQTAQPPPEIREGSTVQLLCEDPYEL